jgi:hypothetical protein
MTTLRFNCDHVRRLVDHAKAAPKHRRGWGDRGKARPCLILVHDEGIYLMSNGEPGLMLADAEKGHDVAYARGFNPHVDGAGVWDAARDAVGGDDFAEYLDVAMFEPALLAGRGDVCVEITQESIRVGARARRGR